MTNVPYRCARQSIKRWFGLVLGGFSLLVAALALPMPQPLWAGELDIVAPLIELPVKPPAPEFSLLTIGGERHRLVDHAGEVVVVNFWASWCLPCLKEMPSFDRAAAALRDDGVIFVAINMGDKPEQVRRYLEKTPLSLTVLLDPGARVSAKWQVTSLPVTYVVDRQGRIHSGALGSRQWDAPEMLARLKGMT